MKLTWNKKKQENINKKRPLSSTNLPFQQEDDNDNNLNTNNNKNNDNSKHSNTSSSDDQDSAAKLADSFRDQGNKLAEVLTLLSFSF